MGKNHTYFCLLCSFKKSSVFRYASLKMQQIITHFKNFKSFSGFSQINLRKRKSFINFWESHNYFQFSIRRSRTLYLSEQKKVKSVSKTFASEKVERSRCLQWAIMMPVWQIPPRESTCKGVSTSSPHQLDLCLVQDEPKTIPNDSEWEKIAMKSTPELSLVSLFS